MEEGSACGSDERSLERLRKWTLHDLCEKGDHERVHELLSAAEAEGDEEWDPSRPLNVSLTVDANARDNTQCTPLHTALLFRRLECVRVLLAHKAKLAPKCAGSPLLTLLLSLAPIADDGEAGAGAGSFVADALPLLLAAGADASALDDAGRSPLHWAAALGLEAAAELMLPRLPPPAPASPPAPAASPPGSARGARAAAGAALATADGQRALVELADKAGATALHLAAAGAHGGMVRWLLARGADARAADRAGDTPAHAAAKAGWAAGAELLEARAGGAAQAQRNGAGLTWREALAPMLPGFVDGADPSEPASAPSPAPSPAPAARDRTLLLTHEQCREHHTCAPITRELSYVPPENASRLEVLLSRAHGTLRARDIARRSRLVTAAPPARMADVLRVHEYEYVRRVLARVGEAHADAARPPGPAPPPEGPGSVGSAEWAERAAAAARAGAVAGPEPGGIRLLDADTSLSRGSWEAALRAAGAVCSAIDSVVSGQARNAFCPVRPPGHHAGPRGVVACERDPDGSHGFCLLNNVAIGAAYAMHHYGRAEFAYAAAAGDAAGAAGAAEAAGPAAAAAPRPRVRRVAIFDFDVHHGNGTEAILRNLYPHELCESVRLPFAHAAVSVMSYRPWLDHEDGANVMFVSSHGYGARRDENSRPVGVFYPGSGASTGWDVNVTTRLAEAAAGAGADASAGAGAGAGAGDAMELESPRAHAATARSDATPREPPAAVASPSAAPQRSQLPPLSGLATPRTAAVAAAPASASAWAGLGSSSAGVSSEARAAPAPLPSLQQLPSEGTPRVPEPLFEASVAQPNVINVAMSHGYGPRQWRRVMAADVLPRLAAFAPDLILVSAGFDAHKADAINLGYMRLAEEDYFWITRQLVKIANATAGGRLVSVLEGGYKVQGRVVSPFARSVAAHVRALAGGFADVWDSARERELLVREMRWEQEQAAAAAAAAAAREAEAEAAAAAAAAAAAEAKVGSGKGKGGGGSAAATPAAGGAADSAASASSASAPAAALASEGGAAPAAVAGASGERAAKRRREGPAPDYAALDAQLKAEEEARLAKKSPKGSPPA